MKIIIKILFFFCILIQTVSAEPIKIMIGTYPMVLQKFNYAENTFDINFYLWTITQDSLYNPGKSLEISNAIKYEIKNQTSGKNYDGSTFTTMHVYSTNYHLWDITNFPFDRQLLTVEIEDARDIDEIIFSPDLKGTNLPPDFKIPGWVLKNFYVASSKQTYESNLGSYENPRSVYSRFTIYFDIKRQGSRLFINYYIGFIISFLLSVIIFAMRPDRIDSRINLSLGSIFPAVGNKYIIDNLLPTTNEFTLSDSIQLIVFCMVVTAIVVTVVTCKLADHHNYALALKVNRYAQCIAIPFFLLIFLFFLLRALLS